MKKTNMKVKMSKRKKRMEGGKRGGGEGIVTHLG
jgi:hypothetical protein